MATKKPTPTKHRKPSVVLQSAPREELIAIVEDGKEQLYLISELSGAQYKAYMKSVARSFSVGKRKKTTPNLAATQHDLIHLATRRVVATDAGGNPTGYEDVDREWVEAQVASVQVALFTLAQDVSGLGADGDEEDEGTDPN